MTRRRIGPPVVRWLSGLLASVALVAAVTGAGVLLSPYVHAHSLLVLYLLAVLPVAVVWGARLAALTAILGTAVFAVSLLPGDPTPAADRQDLISLAEFLGVGIVVVVFG